MTSLFFAVLIAALFSLLFMLETKGESTQPGIRQLGLLTWLSSGNWPAKVGAGLLILGVGALLKYAFINVNMTVEAKLAGGFMLSALIGAASFALRNHPLRRAIHLALAGTAFGVAYLTAYSAYEFFHTVTSVNALALLALVSIAAGTFAVRSNAMSVAILAMAGAYVAPVFAFENVGPLPVYGYYIAISIVSFVMVLMRAWRPLIHLSFLFTLASGIFFAWSVDYYQPQYYGVMQPLLLALIALHLAMPLVERRSVVSPWLMRVDIGYFIALPLVAAALTCMIAPDWQAEGANGMAMLAILWAIAATVLHLYKSIDAFRHAFVAGLLLVAAVLCRMQDIPWALVLLGLTAVTLRLAPFMRMSRTVQELACGAALLFAFLHVVASIFEPIPAQGFLNVIFGERLLVAALLGYVAWIATQRQITIAKALSLTAAAWAILAIAAELWRIKLDFAAQLIYGVLIATTFVIAALNRRVVVPSAMTTFVVLALTLCGWWTASTASHNVIGMFFALTVIALVVLAWCCRGDARSSSAVFALGMLPPALLPWAQGVADAMNATSHFWMFNAFVIGALLSMLMARSVIAQQQKWHTTQQLHFYVIAIGLSLTTLFHIERGALPVAFELLALLYLAIATALSAAEGQTRSVQPGIVLIVAVTLVLQAMLLRALGPDGVLTIFDLAQMKLRAVVSLIWVVLGAGLTWSGVKVSSQQVWSAGAALLVIAAGKLVLFDFHSLGQLGNILALIAAGLVFLGVAWLAPFPPKAKPSVAKPWSGAKPATTEPAAQ